MLYQKRHSTVGKGPSTGHCYIYSKESELAYTMSMYSFLYPESEDSFFSLHWQSESQC